MVPFLLFFSIAQAQLHSSHLPTANRYATTGAVAALRPRTSASGCTAPPQDNAHVPPHPRRSLSPPPEVTVAGPCCHLKRTVLDRSLLPCSTGMIRVHFLAAGSPSAYFRFFAARDEFAPPQRAWLVDSVRGSMIPKFLEFY